VNISQPKPRSEKFDDDNNNNSNNNKITQYWNVHGSQKAATE